MVSDKVQNVGAFVEKYLYEYRVLGVRLHTWRQWAKGSIWLCLIFGATGTALAYAAGEREQGLYRYGILGGVGALALFILRMLADDAYQLEAAKTYMVDFLENTYAHRYAKANQKEIQVTVQRADEVPEKMDVEENESAYSEQEQRPLSEETVPASAAPVNAVSVNEKRYTEDTAGFQIPSGRHRRQAGADKRGKDPGNPGRVPRLTGANPPFYGSLRCSGITGIA